VQWNAQPLWQLFEAHGVDVATMTARPIEGPVMVPREPLVPETEEAELQQKAHQLSKEWNRLNRRIDRATGRGWRWS